MGTFMSKKLVFRENIEYILVFAEGVLNSPDVSKGVVENFIDDLGLNHLNCRIAYVTNDYGYKHAIETVEYLERDCLTTDETLVLVTNMTQFLYPGTFDTWNEEQHKYLTYIVDKNGVFHWIHDLTTRELRPGHNLEKLYQCGEFDYE